MSNPAPARVLIDPSVHSDVTRAPREAGHDVAAVAEWPKDPGDAEILRAAYDQHRVVVMPDKDFGELAVSSGMPHRGIVRLVRMAAAGQVEGAPGALARCGDELAADAIATVEPGRVRIRPADPN